MLYLSENISRADVLDILFIILLAASIYAILPERFQLLDALRSAVISGIILCLWAAALIKVGLWSTKSIVTLLIWFIPNICISIVRKFKK